MKIGAISTDWLLTDQIGDVTFARKPIIGGTGSYRQIIPGTELAKHGHTFVATCMENLSSSDSGLFIVTDFDGNKHFDCDILWLQRLMGEDMPERIKRARACGQVVINDLDDWFWGLPTTNVAFHMTHPKSNPLFNRDFYLKAIQAGSGVTVSTKYLAGRLDKIGIPTVLCRNALDIDQWPVLDATDTGNVGWVGGIPWRGSDLAQLKGILGPFLEKHGLTFVHGGHSPQGPSAMEQLGIDPTKVECMTAPILDFAEYQKLWEPIDVLVAPLEESSFNRSKSSLKLFEGSASGLPCIGVSWHEEYQWWAKESAVRLARNARDWIKHLEALLDPVVRKEEGAINRAAAEKQSIGELWPVWEQAFESIKAAS